MLHRVSVALWILAVGSLVTVVAVQGDRLDRARALHAERAADYMSLAAETSVLRAHLVDALNHALVSDPIPSAEAVQPHVLYAVVDEDCEASRRALEIIAGGVKDARLVVLGNGGAVAEGLPWRERFGPQVDWSRFGSTHPILARVPQGVTPIFVEVSHGVVVDLVVGQPRAEWLRQTRAGMPPLCVVEPGALLPVEGRPRRIVPHDGRRVELTEALLLVPQGRPAGLLVEAWLKHLAQARLSRACDRHAAALGRGFRALALRDTRSRWGSCTHDGRLMFSWRLAMAPPEVLDYVAAHEVAHLLHMDHSAAFWAATGRLMPDYARHRDWLRRHGHELLAWRFRS